MNTSEYLEKTAEIGEWYKEEVTKALREYESGCESIIARLVTGPVEDCAPQDPCLETRNTYLKKMQSLQDQYGAKLAMIQKKYQEDADNEWIQKITDIATQVSDLRVKQSETTITEKFDACISKIQESNKILINELTFGKLFKICLKNLFKTNS